MRIGNDTNETGNKKPVVILGAGGHARVLISLLRLIDRPIAALLDDDPAKQGEAIGAADLTVQGTHDAVQTFNADDIELVNAIGSTHRPTARQAVYERFAATGYTFATLIHPAAVVAPEVNIEQGTQIMAGAVIQPHATLKQNCLINTSVSIDHDTTIGQHTHIAPGATICGNVTIGPACHIGANATIVQGITLGQHVVAGAGATVLSDIPDGLIVVGTPARPHQ